MNEHRELLVTRKDGSEHTILYDAADGAVVESRRWYLSESNSVPGLFYARTSQKKANGKWGHLSMHILLMGGPLVDHINHNGLDNRRSNLRVVDKRMNAANSRPRKDSAASQYKGVGWRPHANRWVARVQGKHLGYFVDEVEAA